MRTAFIYSCLVMMFCPSSSAQQKIKFSSINTGGIIIGQTKVNGLFQSVNGLTYQKWFAGVGAGADYYYHKSIPIFIDARRYLGKSDAVFLYADLGYNRPWDNKPGDEVFSYGSYHFTGGVYTDVGAGYAFKLIPNFSLIVSGGFSYKNIRSRVGVLYPCLVPPCNEEMNSYNYEFNRFVLKAGIQFR
jgi:hypothetical protein